VSLLSSAQNTAISTDKPRSDDSSGGLEARARFLSEGEGEGFE
jgi:hypothetical protein